MNKDNIINLLYKLLLTCLLVTIALVLVIIFRNYFDKTTLLILFLSILLFLSIFTILLFLRKKIHKRIPYKPAKYFLDKIDKLIRSNCVKIFLFWTDRLLILFLVFTPLAITNWFTPKFVKDVLDELKNGGKISNYWFFPWTWDNPILFVIYFIIIGVLLYIFEKRIQRKKVKYRAKFKAHNFAIFIDIILVVTLIVSFLCFYFLRTSLFDETVAFRIITFIINYNLSFMLPLICLLPLLYILPDLTTNNNNNTEDHVGNILEYFRNFYKLLWFNNPLIITIGIFAIFLPVGIIKIYPMVNGISLAKEGEGIEMFQFSLGVLKVLTPMSLIFPLFTRLLKNYDKTFESGFHRELSHTISSMNEHIIIFGYGVLARDTIKELKERDIIGDNNRKEVMPSKLEKGEIYKNIIIVHEDEKIFDAVHEDPLFGKIGVLKLNFESNPESRLYKIPILIPGIIGNVDYHSIYDRSKVADSILFISTIPDCEQIDKLSEFMKENKYNGIITCQDFDQLKTLSTNFDSSEQTIRFICPSFIEGEALGRTIFAAAARFLASKEIDGERKEVMKTIDPNKIKERLPRILVVGEEKNIPYLIDTYFIELQLINFLRIDDEQKDIDINLCIFSNEEFYKRKDTTYGNSINGELTYKQWDKFVKYQGSNSSGFNIISDVFIGETDYVNNIRKFLKKDKPDIIVITHNSMNAIIKILKSWIDSIENFKNEDKYCPTILVETKGTFGSENIEKKVRTLLERYKRYYIDEKGIDDAFYPTQDYDAMIRVYDNVKEEIGSFASTLTIENLPMNNFTEKNLAPIGLHCVVENDSYIQTLLCNNLARLEPIKPDDAKLSIIKSDNPKRPSFQSTQFQNCPGREEPGSEKTNCFFIEADIILLDTEEIKIKNLKNEEKVCKSSVILPEEQKFFLPDIFGENCFDKHCIHSETCKSTNNQPPNKSNNKNGDVIPYAKLFLCSNNYDVPGSLAHAFNNLLFLETSFDKEKHSGVISITSLRAFPAYTHGFYNNEIYGNVIALKKDKVKEIENNFQTPSISFIRICPITGIKDWKDYSIILKDFLNSFFPENNDEIPVYDLEGKEYNIEIKRVANAENSSKNKGLKTHDKFCPRTCSGAKRSNNMC